MSFNLKLHAPRIEMHGRNVAADIEKAHIPKAQDAKVKGAMMAEDSDSSSEVLIRFLCQHLWASTDVLKRLFGSHRARL